MFDDRIPGDLEYPEKTHAAQDRDAKRGHDFGLNQYGFQDSPTNNEAVKTVEEGDKVSLKPQTVHLQKHLGSEECQKDLVCCV